MSVASGLADPQAQTVDGRAVPAGLLGDMVEGDIRGDLAAQVETHGYLLLRGVHDAGEVEAARLEVLGRLGEVDEVALPHADAIATGRSRRAELHPDLGAFWRSVSDGPALRRVVNGPRIKALAARLFGELPAHFGFAWLRAMPAGRASPLHVDHPYMNRGSRRLVTVWTPLGHVARDEGPLYVVEDSHRDPDIRAKFEGHDVDRDPSRPGHFDAADIAAAKGVRLLSAAFAPGDCVIFGMFTAHGAFDNATRTGRVRLSCDTRFQPAADPMDERFAGADPPAHGGKGYGCLSAARPMNAPMLRR
jgi:ectoine hydroxylase-related dioxygenase (phytanoyl-CoA dioxygenase family)